MSLHKFAEQVASQGRGDDSLLVHMTPDEVQRLQKFAQANGTSLTINPTTGLPEAGMLSDLFKAIAPIALGAFLGPAGAAIGGGFMSAGMAGLAVGGITTLATGSLSRGLMAGLGAYGGAGLGASLMGGGTAAIGSAAEGIQGPVGSSESGFSASQAISAAPKADVLSAGYNAATANPAAMGAFAKQNLGNLAYAAAPIAAGLMVPTTTKLPDPKDTGYIRQMAYNINPDTGRPDPLYGRVEMAPVKASEFGNKTFQGQRNLFYQQNQNQNQNPYELGVGSLNQPPQPVKPMASGGSAGIVALADGGDVIRMANGTPPKMLSDEELYQASGLSGQAGWEAAAKARDAQNAAMNQYYSPIATDYVNTAATNPKITASDFITGANTAGFGLTQPLTTALQGSGLSAADQYALTHRLDDAAGIATAPKAAQDFYNNMGYIAGALPGDQGGLSGLYANINYSAKGLQDEINAGKISVDDAKKLARGEMTRVGVNDRDIKNATGVDFNNLFTPKTVVTPPPDPFVSVTPGEVKLPTATTYTNGAFGNYGSGPATGVDSNGKTVSIATPGDIISNPDGTRTVVPNIPGRPYGGFTGMDPVKSAYTAGGGSLGYTAPVPKTAAEHNATYNKMTDDSLDAYNFLMGKGKNLTQRKAETQNRPVMQRYDEAILGKKMGKPVATTAGTDKVTTVVGVPGNPQSYFDEKAYLAAHPDVQAELTTGKSVSGKPVQFSSGYEHWLKYGQPAGWAFSGDYTGYKTAAALATSGGATGASGGPGGTSSTSGNNSGTISGLTPAPANDSIADTAMSPDSDNGVDAEGGYYSRGKLNYGSKNMAMGGYAMGGGLGSLGSYSDGGRLLKGPGDGVSDSIPATIGAKSQPARLADGEFVVPARIVSELGNGSTDAGAKKLYAMLDRVQRARGKTTGKDRVAANSRSDKYLPA